MLLQNWWFTTLLEQAYTKCPPLKGNIEADFVVVGGGAAGISAAHYLSTNGQKVVLLERNIIGGSSTGKSAGFLTPDSELELSQLIRRFGKEGANDIWNVAVSGVKMMVDNIRSNNIQCDLQTQNSLFLANDKASIGDVEEERNSRKEMGWQYQYYNQQETPDVIGSDGYFGAVRYEDTYGVDPLQYAQGMKTVLLKNGVQVFEASEVIKVDGHTVHTHLGSVKAKQIIFCIDKLEEKISELSWQVFHAQTFLSISEPLSDSEIQQLFPMGKMQCWDTDLVYSYYRLTGDNRLLLGGGSALTTFAKNDTHLSFVIDEVHKKFKKKFPFLQNLSFVQYWPGRIDTTKDLLPIVTKDVNRPWIHFTLGSVGLPWATFCGDFVARHALGNDVSDKKYYQYFSAKRPFFIPNWLEQIIGKQLAFSLNNSYAKYKQVDNDKIKTRENEF
ncbi:MAG: hypothetical protein RJA07_642 [Bacteroidota bacterium]|jgi:gamma-glutamylputrescine oxidase